MSGQVISMFGERIADKVMPVRPEPSTAVELSDATARQVERDSLTDRLGTWVAVGVGVGVFFAMRNWRRGTRKRQGDV